MTTEEFINEFYVDRYHTQSLKWDLLEERFGNPNLLPLWVADMDFKVSPAIANTLQKQIEHGIFGYTFAGSSYFEAYKKWMLDHFDWSIDKEWIRFSKGAVQSIYDIIKVFTEEKDGVIIQTPVYYPFHDAVNDTNRNLVTVDLINNEGYFEIDYEGFEQAIIENHIKLYIHCSPHNPVGRVWSEEEQQKLFEICKRHNVLIISDEIHQDLTFDTHHVPAAKVNDGNYRKQIITINSATKSFNIAGLTHCHILISNDKLREQYDKYAQSSIKSELNVAGLLATEAAYTGGEPWLKEIKKVIEINYRYVRDTFKENIPEIVISPLEGSYLLFIDLRNVVPNQDVKDFIQNQCGLAVDYGEWFGENYRGFIRFNLATKPENIKKAVSSIITHLNKVDS